MPGRTALSPGLLPAALLAVLAVLSSAGCYPASGPAPGDTVEQERFWTTESVANRTEALRQMLIAHCPAADRTEVAEVAGGTVRYGELLKDEYDLTRPPEHHNLAVRAGIKKRGLCYELADDLYARLRAMRLRTIDLHLVQADAGHITDEHNCVVATDAGKPMKTGVLLDLWRYAGKARFLPVAVDHHTWHELPKPADPPALVEDDTGLAGMPKLVTEHKPGPTPPVQQAAAKSQPPAVRTPPPAQAASSQQPAAAAPSNAARQPAAAWWTPRRPPAAAAAGGPATRPASPAATPIAAAPSSPTPRSPAAAATPATRPTAQPPASRRQ